MTTDATGKLPVKVVLLSPISPSGTLALVEVVTVSLDSAYPQEAAEVVNSIVDAYMTAQGARKKTTAAEMLQTMTTMTT